MSSLVHLNADVEQRASSRLLQEFYPRFILFCGS